MSARNKDRRPVEPLSSVELEAFAEIDPEAARRLAISAVESFSTHGFYGTTTREIAVGAGMSPAAMYVHFDTKDDVLARVCHLAHEVALNVMLAATTQSTPKTASERLFELVHDLTLWHAENHRLARVALYQFDALSAADFKSLIPLRSATVKVIGHVLKDGMASGEFKIPDLNAATNCILAMCIDVVRWYAPGKETLARSTAKEYAHLAVAMVEAR